MERDYLAELESRIMRRLQADDGTGPPPIVGIMRDVEVYGSLMAREGFKEGAGWLADSRNHNTPFNTAASERYPIMHTRRVLREEPVPGSGEGAPVYRWNRSFGGGRLESSRGAGYMWDSRDLRSHEVGVMRHALDLHNEPYRTEEVPADESNPWGDE
jgi:hypothetical protein